MAMVGADENWWLALCETLTRRLDREVLSSPLQENKNIIEYKLKSGAYVNDNLTHQFFNFFASVLQNSQNDSVGVGKNKARFELSRVKCLHVEYLFVKICNFSNL